MPKKNLLLSAALTAFILVVVTGIASAYKQVSATIAAVQATPTTVEMVVELPTALPTPTDVVLVMLTHQEAALVAANFLGQTDIYSVENVVWEGVDAYKVVFSSGDTVYVSMYGDVLGTEAPPVTVVVSNNSGGKTNTVAPAPAQHHDDDHDDDHGDDHDD